MDIYQQTSLYLQKSNIDQVLSFNDFTLDIFSGNKYINKVFSGLQLDFVLTRQGGYSSN